MTDTIAISYHTAAHCRVNAPDAILIELREFFTYDVPGARFMPKFKNKHWDGKIRLFNSIERLLPTGLIYRLIEFAKQNDCELKADKQSLPARLKLNAEQFHQWCMNLVILGNDGQVITPKDYQIQGAYDALKWNKRTILSPTGSGKSLIIYLICKYLLENEFEDAEKVLILVPTINLVSQMKQDLSDYSDGVYADCIHAIHGGIENTSANARIYISTWQSLYKQPAEYFDCFGALIGDECHQYKSTEIKRAPEKCKNATFRIGLTGTIANNEKNKANIATIEGVFGKVVRPKTDAGVEVHTKTLMNRGELVPIDIQIISLKYNDEVSAKIQAVHDYAAEVDYITNSFRRDAIIVREAFSETGNVLVLFFNIEHGRRMEKIANLFREKTKSTRKVMFVSGSTKVDERENLRRIMETESNCITFASMGVFSTGVNIRNLPNLYLAHPRKSLIAVLQSIGRGLRKHSEKTHLNVKDFVDDFRVKGKKKENFLLKHAAERLQIYLKSGFPHSFATISIN